MSDPIFYRQRLTRVDWAYIYERLDHMAEGLSSGVAPLVPRDFPEERDRAAEELEQLSEDAATCVDEYIEQFFQRGKWPQTRAKERWFLRYRIRYLQFVLEFLDGLPKLIEVALCTVADPEYDKLIEWLLTTFWREQYAGGSSGILRAFSREVRQRLGHHIEW